MDVDKCTRYHTHPEHGIAVLRLASVEVSAKYIVSQCRLVWGGSPMQNHPSRLQGTDKDFAPLKESENEDRCINP